MANKNTAGRLFVNTMKRIDRIHREIDKRARNGKYNEDDTHNKYTLTQNGERVWSF
jgi:hypothetical protein